MEEGLWKEKATQTVSENAENKWKREGASHSFLKICRLYRSVSCI